MYRLRVYLEDFKKECILGPIFKFLEVIFELLLPTIMAMIINQGIVKGDTTYVVRMGGLMVLMALCGYGCAFVCQKMASRASQGFGTRLRHELFKHIVSFSYAQQDRFGASTLTNRITNDINQLQVWVAMMIRLVSRSPFICIGSILMSFFLDVQLGFLLLAATPVLAGILYWITKYAAPLYRSYQEKLDALSIILRENLSGIRVIRAFSKTPWEAKRFTQTNHVLTEDGIAIGWTSSFLNPLTSLVINGIILIALWIGGIRIQAGALSQGQIIAFIQYVSQILAAMVALSNLVVIITKSMSSAARINEVLDAPVEKDTPDITAPQPISSEPLIVFDNVSFRYHTTGEYALKDISVSITKGETIGIIGGTGSGKSTFIHLIGRFYDVTDGEIRVEGVPLSLYPLQTLRKKIGIAPQHPLLFSGTIVENLKWGASTASLAEITSAAQIAQADEFIRSLPQGYHTMLERGGNNLSGGQRQRLTIARALVSKPQILILDDSSSALDFLTDAKLRQALRKSDEEQTVLLVAQRVGTVQNADRIFVFEDGRIVGIGTHAALYKSCPAYQEICLSQQSEEEVQR